MNDRKPSFNCRTYNKLIKEKFPGKDITFHRSPDDYFYFSGTDGITGIDSIYIYSIRDLTPDMVLGEIYAKYPKGE